MEPPPTPLAQIFLSFLPKFYPNDIQAHIRSASAPSKPPPLAISGLETPSLGHFWLRPWSNGRPLPSSKVSYYWRVIPTATISDRLHLLVRVDPSNEN